MDEGMDQGRPEDADANDTLDTAADEMNENPANNPRPGHVWVLGRLEDEAKLKADVERIMLESSQRASKVAHDRQTLLLHAREHQFMLEQLKQLLPSDAFASLLQQMPSAFAGPADAAISPRLDTPSSHVKAKGRPSGMRRLFSSKREESFENESTGVDSGSPRPSTSSIPRTPTLPRKMSDLTIASPESLNSRSSAGNVLPDTPKANELDLPIFVYGINMFPSILVNSAKVSLNPQSFLETHMCSAELSGFLRTSVKQADWPALIGVSDARSRLKAELVFKTNHLFPGRRWCDYVSVTSGGHNSTSDRARTLEPIGTVSESFKKKAVRDPKTGVVTKLDDLARKVPVHPDDVFDMEESFTPPKVDGMLVFGLNDEQRSHLDHYCGCTSSSGKPLSRPLYTKERVIVDFNIRVENSPSTPRFAGPEYMSSNPPSSSKPAIPRKPVATQPPSPEQDPKHSSSGKSPTVSPSQSYDPAAVTFDPAIDPHPYDPKLHPFKPIDAMSDDEYDSFLALDRRWRAACIKWNLRPKIAAIRADEQYAERADKMRKMDLIMGIMDAHQREVEDAATAAGTASPDKEAFTSTTMSTTASANAAMSTPHTSFGSETTAALAGSSFGSALVHTRLLDGKTEYELMPLRVEAYTYVWAGHWHELESPLEKPWSEEVYYQRS